MEDVSYVGIILVGPKTFDYLQLKSPVFLGLLSLSLSSVFLSVCFWPLCLFVCLCVCLVLRNFENMTSSGRATKTAL